MLLGLGVTPEKKGRRATQSSSGPRQFQILHAEDPHLVFYHVRGGALFVGTENQTTWLPRFPPSLQNLKHHPCT